VAAGDLVTVNYTGTLLDGSQFDTSIGKPPLTFRVGAGSVIDLLSIAGK
jgi:FKBP-type peptidyl-prolyl cis-trans isomerase